MSYINITDTLSTLISPIYKDVMKYRNDERDKADRQEKQKQIEKLEDERK